MSCLSHFMRFMRFLIPLLFLAVPALAQELPVVQLKAGMHLIRAEVAADYATRGRGLMYRKSLPQNGGMLFIFEQPAIHCMWMKNTPLPLSVAFLDDQGEIINIADMQPHSEQTHCATRPALYALEMAQGWFAQRAVKPGAKLGGLEQAKAPR
jgi:uncharacterized protein